MDFLSSLPSFDLDFDDLYFGSLDLIEQDHRFVDASIQTQTYQGMSVQVLNTSIPGYHNQPDTDENNPEFFNSLNKYHIEPLTISQRASETASQTAVFFETDIPDIPTSVDEHIPENSGNEPINDTPSSIPDMSRIQHICLSGSEPEIREPAPQSHSNPDYPLNHLPDVLSNPQDLRPLTVVNPINLNQTANENQTPRVKDIVDDNASIIEREREHKRNQMRERRKDPVYAERQRKRDRNRYQNDPDFAERKRKLNRKRNRERRRERYQNDPDFAERIKAYRRERYRNDPDFAERIRKRNSEYKKRNTEYNKSECKRKLRKDSTVHPDQ
ncbi:hypothetical protein [Endozoicomonas sp. SESOKO1]|uniref:hypothetical protein n=1 Tax=Endozoicomonas sp. SESOKO1 TaxID=2828742 RepID=UPI002147CE8C|nr:hypothetical protein [Endozoicomonas sp. SESOKO1]